MEISSLDCYTTQPILDTKVIQSGYVEEGFLEVFDLINAFQSTKKFSSWITNEKFKNVVYKNKIMNRNYTREWAYIFEEKSFFFGNLKLDENKIPEDVKALLLSLNSSLSEIQQLPGFEKRRIHSILTESHYTVISHAIYQELIVGNFWEIYNLPILLELYEQKQDPLRYWRKTRRE